jgi:cytochrome c551/c552
VKQNSWFFKHSSCAASKAPNLRAANLIALTCLAGNLFGAVQPGVPARVLINQYCVGCHNQKVKTAGVSVQALDPANVGQDAAIWEKVLRKVSAGQMPPAGLPRPQTAASEVFTQWLGEELDHAAAAHPNPGHPTIHRLNRAEYSNAIRDLLALDIKPGSKLPADDTGYGFDNIGDVLSLSPVLVDRYMSVGRMVSRLAVGDPNLKPEVNEFESPRPGRGGVRNERVGNDLPFDSAGGMVIQYAFPVDAEYVFRVKALSGGTAPPKVYELRAPVKAGIRTVGVTFLADNQIPEVVPAFGGAGVNAAAAAAAAAGGRAGGRALPAKMDLRLDGARLQLFDTTAPRFGTFAIAGPYNITGVGDSPSRQKIFVCKPASANEENPCARKILASLGRRAYRRPFTDADLQPLLALYEAGRREGNFDNGIEMALRALLVSPNFLFRVERDPAASPAGSVYAVNDFELASRLSFFLWSSIPDEELLSLAEKGKLRDPAVLSEQVSRMLEDRRSEAFVGNFAGQWLFLRNLAQVKPDQDAFPKFDASLRDSFERETELFFEAILRENRPVTDLLSANFTYLNQRLAEHYNIPDVYGSQFRRITLTDPSRGGLLGQGSILTVTSYPNRTSVVQRGKWVLENLLGTPPPPPPPDIPALEPHAKDGKLLTVRQQMEQHRANATCASCHSRMDPIGFSLENYDGVGAWRTKDAGSAIDATGKMPDGTVFQGPSGLKNLLLTSHRDEFIATFTEKLMTYALGRGVEYYDRPAMRAIMRDAAKQNNSIPAIINSIVQSPQFQMRRTHEL